MVFDTTYNVTADGMKLTMFVVRSTSLQDRFFPVMHCLHRALDTDLYRRIFRAFFLCFGLLGSDGGFSGVTIDFADAISEGYAIACREVTGKDSLEDGAGGTGSFVRMCKFHFLKNLLAFLRSAGASPDQQQAAIAAAHSMLTFASEHGRLSKGFKTAEKQLLQLLSGHSGYDSWRKWWLGNNGGLHWACLTDVGPGTARHVLYDTTNASESQNRVVKMDHGVSNLPGLALREILDMQREKEQQYQLALTGTRPSGRRKQAQERNVKAARTTFASSSQKAHRGKHQVEGQGPPKTVAAYKAQERKSVAGPLTKATGGLQLKNLTSKSFPLWKWKRNSCAFDTVLATAFFALRSIPLPMLVGCAGEPAAPNPPVFGTRSAARSPSAIRFTVERLCERLGQAWASSADPDDELGCIRDEFRGALAGAMGLSVFEGRNSFASAADAMRVICTAITRPQRPSSSGSSGSTAEDFDPFHKCITTRLLQRRKCSSLQSMVEDPEVDPRSLLLFFEFSLFDHQRKRVSLREYECLEIPLTIQLTGSASAFKFLCCIDCNGNHFRAHVLHHSDRVFTANQRTVLPGMYLVDPLNHRRAEMSAGVPGSSEALAQSLPRFRGGRFHPHLIIYFRTS